MKSPSRPSTAQRSTGTLQEAAVLLGCSVRTVRRFIATGELTGYRVGARLVRVDLEEVERLLRPIPTVGVNR